MKLLKHKRMRIAINAIAAIFILLFKLILRKRRRVTYFNVSTGVAEYKTTYYVLYLIPVLRLRERIPNVK